MNKKECDFLLINNNNTRTKFAISKDNKIVGNKYLNSKDINVKNIKELLKEWTYKNILLASVVPKDEKHFFKINKNLPIIKVTNEIKLGIKIDFDDPSSIGADRLANAVAVSHMKSDYIVVVDFGTAITFDIIKSNPTTYIGGVIAPGLKAMNHYLHTHTALLPKVDEIKKPKTVVGKKTMQAMQTGAYHGYRGLVKEILEQIKIELKSDIKIISTGGYAELFCESFFEIKDIDPLLTMKGLLKIAKLNFNK